jgi:2-methylcitrate dehydratase PrpD
MSTTSATSVTEQVAEWIVKAQYDEIPDTAVLAVKERFIDTIGVQFAGMSVSTGQVLSEWVRAQGGRPDSSVVAGGYKTTAAYATLLNAAAGHALEYDDIAPFSGHYANPLTAAAVAVGEKLGSSGREVIAAWLVGYEVIGQTAKPSASPEGSSLLVRGWFNQGFQPVLGVAALTGRLLGLDVTQTRMALGIAAASMSGLVKNRASDAKSYTAGHAAMQGVAAAELAAIGFTGNPDILDGDMGVARLVGPGFGEAEQILDGLGRWAMAARPSTMRLHASCGASHWSQDAMQQIVRRDAPDPREIESIEVTIPGFLLQNVPYHQPRTGLEGKYSLEYCVAAVALDGRAGLHSYTDEAVNRPEAQDLIDRVTYVPTDVVDRGSLNSRVAVTLTTGEVLEATASSSHGAADDPLTTPELLGKFHECAAGLVPEAERDAVVDTCWRLDSLDDVSELARLIGASR